MSQDYRHLLIKPGEGEETNTAVIKIRNGDLGGDFSVMQATIEAHQLLVPHTHQYEDQAVFVIEGELEFEVGGEAGTRFTAPAGSYIVKPRKISHGFWNATNQTAHYIELSGRDGFEKFVDSTEEDGTVQAAANADEYGLTFHYDQVPRLMRQHGLTSLSGTDMPWEGAPAPSGPPGPPRRKRP